MSHASETSPSSAQPTQPMQHGHRPASAERIPATLVPEAGWHFLHVFYRVNRSILNGMFKHDRKKGIKQIVAALDKSREGAPDQVQCFAVPGHKADFGIVMAGTDLKAVHGVQLAIQTSNLGPALIPSYSFYSITEISEYVPDVEEYGRILREREGVDPESPAYAAKLNAYSERLGPMNKQRLFPDFPEWPCLCFYPMSKMRDGDQNWYTLPFAERSELMSQHGRSGMKFAGKVSQVITASTGLDDWEWGVTLWGRNPSYLKDIVYTMRFDESSAKYALFGDFYFGYLMSATELMQTLRIS